MCEGSGRRAATGGRCVAAREEGLDRRREGMDGRVKGPVVARVLRARAVVAERDGERVEGARGAFGVREGGVEGRRDPLRHKGM